MLLTVRFWLAFMMVLTLGAQAPALELTVLHINDSHSFLDDTAERLLPGGTPVTARLGGWARLARAVEEERDAGRADNRSVALFHAGDAVQGDLYFTRYGGRPEMELLDRLGFEAMVLGNHEFDRGGAFLARMLGFARLPVLGANVDASGVPELAGRITPFVVLDFNGESVGVVGLSLRDTPVLSSPGPGLSFSDEAAAARSAVAELERAGVNKIILLTHVGLARDMELAATVPGVDLIVGGHSHSLLGDAEALAGLGLTADNAYPVLVAGPDGDPVYVVTAWKWARVLGRFDVSFDKSGRITAAQGRPLLLVGDVFEASGADGERETLTGRAREDILALVNRNPAAAVVPADAQIDAFLKPYRDGVAAMRQETVGRASADLPHIRVPDMDVTGRGLHGGSLIAPLVARSMLERLAATGGPADMALINAGSVRHGLEQGGITVGMIHTMLPFGNTIVVVELTGAQVVRALENGVGRGGGAFPYVSGMRFKADMNRPEGSRISDVALVGVGGAAIPLDPARTYRVATNAYVARGGDGYAVMQEASNATDTGFVDALVFLGFVAGTKVLDPPTTTGVTYIPVR
ncbi:bifunctional NAD pyrophosphatase/5'-nucleotidase [Pseudodesulfovibrio sp. F-1]|uniref:Bifunctional NAD pyrophosphatase/5'-nucleotidase n=1 Tax=Pseudodesulfovibrio alkaliphilus TaxID=2661613 RepID=A0A7K1KK32_9BACT|nr:5'-nucleotidase C-terminal domain-containing protein [Pseudodesulfovibrio alkaliphilus]MUM76351.1 bifunctional NAD pyrophosphatase/5'-nucleotidase [Pseudodesulfovibrio alkaliphilus]